MDHLRRALALLLPLLAGLTVIAAPAQAAPPGNDNRADAIPMVYGNTYGTFTAEATNESGEAQPCGVTSGHSVWYRFTPSVAATYVLDATGSPLDTVLSVENAAGTTLACNDDVAPGTTASRLEVALTAGTTYYVRVAGFGSASGNFAMFLFAKPPANDDRADAAYLSLSSNQAVPLLQAGTEPDEPSASCENGLQQTVWFRYTATQTGRLTITNGNTWAARMRLYDVTSGTPQPIVCDSYHDGDSGQYGEISQYLRPGRTYLLQVGPRPGTASDQATLSATFAAATAPTNDSFAAPTRLSGTRGAVAVEAGQMTTEGFEWPLYGSTGGIGAHSAWYRWTAPSSGTLRLSVPSWFQRTLVWKDVAHPGLLDPTGLGTLGATPDGGAVRSVPVTRGTTYRILADWRSAGQFTVTYAFASTATAPGPLARPTVKARQRKAVVAWRAPGDGGAAITGYTLTIRSTVAGKKRTVVRKVGPAARRTVLRGLKPGRYRVVVTATNAAGTSAPSPAARFRIR